MAIVTFYQKHDEIRHEAGLAWNWLRNTNQYKADYIKFSSFDKKVNLELENKYGFYPLINPKVKCSYFYMPLQKNKNISKLKRRRLEAPSDFFVAFNIFVSKVLKQKPFDSGIDFETVDMINLYEYEHPEVYGKYQLTPLPEKICISIDPRKQIKPLLLQIENYLKRVKKIYKLKDERPRITDLNLVYKHHILGKFGITKKAIGKEITPYHNDHHKDSQRKKLYRISIKQKNIS